MPSTPAAAAPVSHQTGPNSASAPVPIGPPATAVSVAVPTPHPTAARAAVSAVSHGLQASPSRPVNRAIATPAATGTTAAAQFRTVPGPWAGTAASRGKSGSAGRPVKASGVTVDAVPSAKPGPSP